MDFARPDRAWSSPAGPVHGRPDSPEKLPGPVLGYVQVLHHPGPPAALGDDLPDPVLQLQPAADHRAAGLGPVRDPAVGADAGHVPGRLCEVQQQGLTARSTPRSVPVPLPAPRGVGRALLCVQRSRIGHDLPRAACSRRASNAALSASQSARSCSVAAREDTCRHRVVNAAISATVGGPSATGSKSGCHRSAARAASPSRQPCDRPELSPPLRHTGHLPSAPTACSAEIPRARGRSPRSISTRYIHAPSPSTTFDAIPADHRWGETNTTDTTLRRFGCGNGRGSHAQQEGAAGRSVRRAPGLSQSPATVRDGNQSDPRLTCGVSVLVAAV
jgi:hypothetical protein